MATRDENDTTLKAVLGTLSTLGVLSLILLPRLISRMPAPGPRLKPGELKAADASTRAEQEYWNAESAAARNSCSMARRHFDKAEDYRHMAEKRGKQGDRTGRDLRSAIRHARQEMRKCNA